MKKIITLLMLIFCVSISFAQYTPMTAAGYQFKRILCDSTLHIPSFCGIPTLRNSTAKNGAIAMDTCNYKIYMWTNAAGWGEIIGAGTDTTSLSNRIDQRVKYTDTAAMLLAYLRKQDTANKWVANVTRVNDTTIRVFKGNTITDLKILGKQVDTTSLSNRIDQKLGKSDSTIYYTKYRSDTSRTNIYNAINTKLSKSDSTLFYTKYRSDTSRTNIYNAINQKLNITDTTNKWVNNVTKVNDSTIRVWKGTTSTTIELPRGSGGGGGTGTVYNVSTGYALSGGPINTTGTIIVDSAVLSAKYLRRADTSNLVATKSNLALKLNISDSAAMLSKYLRKVDTSSLSNRINLKLNIADTSNKWVNAVTKKNDSTITVFKGATATDITLPRGSTGSVTNVGTGYGLSGGPITSTGTIIVDSATLSTKYLRRADTSNLVATKSNVALKLNIADTANKWVNNVTKINDTAIRVWKGTTSSVISLAKDVVYTQSPIMSKVSNDSNIIYFNADTANVWRGGGGGGSVGLQDVLTTNNTASNINNFSLSLNEAVSLGDNVNVINAYQIDKPEWQFKVFLDGVNSSLKLGNYGYSPQPEYVTLETDKIEFKKGFYNINRLISPLNSLIDYDIYLPTVESGFPSDVLATVRNLNDTAAAIRADIVGGIGTLQQVTDAGATTTNNIRIENNGVEVHDASRQSVIAIGSNYDIQEKGFYPAIHFKDSISGGYFDLWNQDGEFNLWTTAHVECPDINCGNINSIYYSKASNIQGDNITYANNWGGTLYRDLIRIVPIYRNDTSDVTYYYPATTSANFKDTLATLRDVRAGGGGGGGGTGTVINVATGYGLSGGPITTTGTIIVDTATLSTKYARLGQTQNGRFGNDTATIVMVKVHNDAGVTLTNGKVVALTTSGNNNEAPAIRLANNKGDSTSANTLGFVTGTIANQDTGWVILSGKIEKLNTSAFSNGDIVYLDSINGNITKTKPVAPYHMVYLGIVTKSNAGNGSIFVKAQNGYELDEIHDVQITNKLNNQVLAYSDTQKVWKNRNIYALVDTTPFQRKSIAANTIMANNTSSAANVTGQTYVEKAEQAYTNTLTWIGTTQPSGGNQMYSWSQIGKTVTLIITLNYANASVATTQLTADLPSDCPTPYSWTGMTAANTTLYIGNYSAIVTNTTSPQLSLRSGDCFLKRNAANTGYEISTPTITSTGARLWIFRVTYKAQ